MNYKELIVTAINAAIKGGAAILDVYNNEETEVTIKGDNSPLTQADQKANTAIMAVLESTNVPVLSEEGRNIDYTERAAWEYLWIVDPLDGTKEFIKRNGEFTVNIALVKNGSPVLGVIYVPVTSDLYFGAEGLNAYKIGRVGSYTEVENFDAIASASDMLPIKQDRPFTVVGSRSHMTSETQDYINLLEKEHGQATIMSRGSSLKICMVAEGLADEYPRFAPTMEWDTAAGHGIAKNAGFEMYLHDSNKPLQYNKKDLLNPWFIVKKAI